MVVYELRWDCRSVRHRVEWFATKKDATIRKRALVEKYGHRGFEEFETLITKSDVPTDKYGLVAWLNKQEML